MGDPNNEADLHTTLDRILASLTRLGAPVVGELQPCLSDEAIIEAFRDMPFVPPRELRALYAWRNGTAGYGQFLPFSVFLSLDEAIAEYQGRREVAKEYALDALTEDDLWDPHWFPICRAIYGTDHVVLCSEQEVDAAPILYIDIESDSHDEEYSSLSHMMHVLADSYEAGAITLNSAGNLIEDDAMVGDIRRAYTPARAEVALEELRHGARGQALNQAINDVIELHETRAIEPLLALLREGDAGSRHAAILPLGIIGDERAVAPLLDIIATGPTMRHADRGNLFAYALHLMDQQAHMMSLARVQAIDALERIVARTAQSLPLEPFLAAIDDPEPMVQLRAARRLGASGDVRALPALLAALGNHSPQACYAAIEALGQLGDPRALEPLRQLMQMPENELHVSLRNAATAAVARIEATASNDFSG